MLPKTLALLYLVTVSRAVGVPAAREVNAVEERQVFPCDVPCGEGWCCYYGQNCKPSGGETPYVCVDLLLTNSDGSPMTWPPSHGGPLLSGVSNILTASSIDWSYVSTFLGDSTYPTPTPTTTEDQPAPTDTDTEDAGSKPTKVALGAVLAALVAILI